MSIKKLRVYLAGDVSEVRWRQQVVEECMDLPLEFLCPIDGIDYSGIYIANCSKPMFHVADKLKLDQSDLIFAYLRSGSLSRFSGTSWECGYANALGKPVILVNDMVLKDRQLYELLERMATSHTDSLDYGIALLRELGKEMSFKHSCQGDVT